MMLAHVYICSQCGTKTEGVDRLLDIKLPVISVSVIIYFQFLSLAALRSALGDTSKGT